MFNYRPGIYSIYLSLALLLTFGCSISKDTSSQKIKFIKEIYFTKTNTLNAEGKQNIDRWQQAMVGEIIREDPEKAKNSAVFPPGFLSMMIAEVEPESFMISIGDTLWKTNLNDSVYSYRYDTTEQKTYVYFKKKQQRVNVRDYSSFDTSRLVNYSEHKDETMLISGFNCYKVVFRIKENSVSASAGFSMGDNIYEMYVTEEINLPMAMIIPYQLPDKNYLPLRVVRWSSCCKGAEEITVVDEIIYQH